MNIPCEMAQDLLPLYEDGLCSPASKEAVENHLRTCRQCRVQAEQVRQFTQPELAVQSQKETRAVARSFRKVRLRWLASLVITVMLIPLMLLTVNQIQGQGMCFSNLGHILAAGQYVRALEQRDMEKAAACMDYAGMYQEILSLLEREQAQWEMSCAPVTIDGEVWMAKQGDTTEACPGNVPDALSFWFGQLHNHPGATIIPAGVWQSLVQLEPESFSVTEDGQWRYQEMSYILLNTPWGAYLTEENGAAAQCQDAEEFCAVLELIPEAIYNAALPELHTQAAEQYAYIQQAYGQVGQMTLEEFTAYVSGAYAEDLNRCQLQGYRFSSTGYAGSYFFDGHWHIDYGVEISHGNAHCQVVLSFRIDHGKLNLTGMNHRDSIKGLDDVCELLFLTYPIEEPDDMS